MGNSRNTGYLQNTVKVADNGDISLMHGSTMLMQISSSGAITTTGVISGSNALSASYAATASFVTLAQTASFVANAQSASNAVTAQTASFANTFTVASTLTAQTLVVQTITSSVDFVTGSTRFGSLLTNTHVFSGSVTMNPNGLFVSSSGRVGIGTISPDNTYQGLTIYGSDPSLRLKTTGGSGWTWIEFVNSSGTNNFSMGVNQTTPYFGIKAGAGMDNPNFVLTTSGNVGIGIINPSFPLEVSSTSTGLLGRFTSNQNEAQIRLVNTSTGGRSYSIGSGGNSSGGAKGFYVYDETGGATVFAISGSGNVGIGISNPSYTLHVNGTSYFNSTASFQSTIDVGNANISWGYSGKGIYLSRAGLGPRESLIGRDATSSWWIDIGGSSDWSGVTLARNGGAVVIGASTIAYSNYKLLARVASDRNVAIGNQGTDCSIEAYNDAVSVNVPLRIYGNNIMLLGGNVGVGKTSISTKLDVGGSLNVDARFIQAGVSRVCYAGTVSGNQSLSFSLVVGSQSAVKITAAMNHYGYISGYGCARMSFVGSTPAFSEINISDTTSGNGGAWSFSNGGSGIITISKSAGSYGGGGYYFIEVVGNDPQSIS